MKFRRQDWTTEQIALLVAMYPTNQMQEIIDATGRSKEAIYAKAQSLNLQRQNKTVFGSGNNNGIKFAKGHTPWNAGRSVFKITTRDLVIGEFKRNPVQTTITLSQATGAIRSGCWAVCNDLVKKGLAHVSGWVCDKSTKWNKLAIYTFGPGESVEWTPRHRPPDEPDPYEIQPIPRPQLGLWGVCWPTTTTPAQPAERITS